MFRVHLLCRRRFYLNQTEGKFRVVSDKYLFLEILDLSIIHLYIDSLSPLSSGES